MAKTPNGTLVRWTLRSPGGLEVDTVKLPRQMECGVCGVSTSLVGAAGRIACGRCSAHVVTVLVRSQVDA